MTETKKKVSKPRTPQPPETEKLDLSEAIEQSMHRQRDEQIRCVRVFGDRYRCNWLVRDRTEHWLSFATSSIKKSVFLRASWKDDKLVIEDMGNST